ncbi:AtpZ/AtpI family protein [Alloyangia pacifica]|uniref:ATP synthase protein I n=1 Tax=Alloyangia pacifica TaxID=311180 RepID=A0A1I6UHJ0_9RHOB|nr:AtpZ/AtpI family protein [Alloyangia pacifica]SDH70069.1 ATP synthase protein I [Alloyangia pacifica]SFT00834.1 ATP synthase protein I [Alloyangia pacifica]
MTDEERNHIAEAARRSSAREQLGQETPEPSLGARLGQIGILGWAVVVPTLLGVVLGRMADRAFGTGVFFTAPAIMIGAAIGFHAAWKWMHKQ